jgi:xanthine dehydrogenase accessory factor
MQWRLDTSLEQIRARLEERPPEPVLATIVATAGSTYRKFGARMLIESSGQLTGLLSGGCLENDLVEKARDVATTHKPQLIRYDQRGDDDPIFGIGAGCEGAMDILLEPIHVGSLASESLKCVYASLDTNQPAELFIVTDPNHPLVGTHSRCPPGFSETSVQREIIAPVPRVLILGAGLDAQPLVRFLRELHWQVTVVDHRAGLLAHPNFKQVPTHHIPNRQLAGQLDVKSFIAAIVMSHHLLSDQDYLAQLAVSAVPYVGLLGPKARRERLLSQLNDDSRAKLSKRLHAPIGLNIGAMTPESIALAIAAQLHQFAYQITHAATAP